ncbi:MAG: sigma 54-interacting transcriptional regulator [Clostridia bacterium]|nr:sigma 54-interacting transcriptional regulator [Clostridia bacterium]
MSRPLVPVTGEMSDRCVLQSQDLFEMRDTIQQIVDAVAAAMSVDVTVADSSLLRVAGTGPFADCLSARVPRGSAFQKALTCGETVLVDNPRDIEACVSCEGRADCRETFQICTPIRLGGLCIGVLAIVAFTTEQRDRLMERQPSYVSFLERMAELVASKAAEAALIRSIEARTSELEAVIDSIQQGVVCVDQDCRIRHINTRASSMLEIPPGTRLINMDMRLIWPSALLCSCMTQGSNKLNAEETYRTPGGRLVRFLSSVQVLRYGDLITGGVCTFSDLESTHKSAFRAMEKGTDFTFSDIIGGSNALADVKRMAEEAARYDSSILLIGETGTGKELFARAIHNASHRRESPFVGVNCAAIPESLLESELFGYEPGAFTGASKNGKPGKFELADHGTLFLDEIGDMPLFLQAKLLRVIQNMEITRVGGVYSKRVDVRIVSATNQDLNAFIAQGRFRPDLYYRLNVVPIRLPALRERREDISVLTQYFAVHYAGLFNKDVRGLTDEALEALLEYSWPGNVRELENVIEFAVNFAKGDRITIDDVRPRLPEMRERCSAGLDLKTALDQCALKLVEERLAVYGRDAAGKERAAGELGISRATLYRILSQR